MNKTSCKDRIKKYLETCNCWVSGMVIEQKAVEANYKASYGAREARRLAEAGEIQRREDNKGYVWYAPNKTPKPVQYRTEPKIIIKPDGTRAVVLQQVAYE